MKQLFRHFWFWLTRKIDSLRFLTKLDVDYNKYKADYHKPKDAP